jgi:hypothetical protein
VARWLDGESQASATALAGGRPAAAHSQEAKAVTTRLRLGAASPSRKSPSGESNGFQFDNTAVFRRLKFLIVINEHSLLCLAIRVGRRCKAKDVVATLEELTSL